MPAIEDSSKFEGPWRRDGPLPDIPERESSRRRFDTVSSHDRTAAVSDQSSDWRSNRIRAPEPEAPPFKRKGSGFSTSQSGLADKEENWSIGSRFKPSDDSRTGNPRTRETGADELDWRSAVRPGPKSVGRHDGSRTYCLLIATNPAINNIFSYDVYSPYPTNGTPQVGTATPFRERII